MRPLIAAEPMFLAPKPEIVSESNLTVAVGVCAVVPIAEIKLKIIAESQIIFFIFSLDFRRLKPAAMYKYLSQITSQCCGGFFVTGSFFFGCGFSILASGGFSSDGLAFVGWTNR